MVDNEFKNLFLEYEVSNLLTDGSGYLCYQIAGPILVRKWS